MDLEIKLFLNGKEVTGLKVDEYHINVLGDLININVDLYKEKPVRKITKKKARPKSK